MARIMKTYSIRIDDGYGRFEYHTSIQANSVWDARKQWKQRGAPSQTRSFRVSLEDTK